MIRSIGLYFTLLYCVSNCQEDSPHLKVTVIYPLISATDISTIDSIVCNSDPQEFQFDLLISELQPPVSIMHCLRIPPTSTVALTYPEQLSDISSVDHARIASLYQNAGPLTGIDIIASKISQADVVLVGDNIYRSPYKFMLHVFAMIPNAPTALVFSSTFLASWSSETLLSPLAYVLAVAVYGGSSSGGVSDSSLTFRDLSGRVRGSRAFSRSPATCHISDKHDCSYAGTGSCVSSDTAGAVFDEGEGGGIGGRCVWRRRRPVPDPQDASSADATRPPFVSTEESSFLVELSRQVRRGQVDASAAELCSGREGLCGDAAYMDRLFGGGGREVLSRIRIASDTSSVTRQSSALLCMIYTRHTHIDRSGQDSNSSRERTPLEAIVTTWAKRCDGFLAFSDATDWSLGAVDTAFIHAMVHQHRNITPWQESYDKMWPKAQLIWKAVAMSDLIDVYDYFLLGGDDMYVIVENVKNVLQSERVHNLQGRVFTTLPIRCLVCTGH